MAKLDWETLEEQISFPKNFDRASEEVRKKFRFRVIFAIFVIFVFVILFRTNVFYLVCCVFCFCVSCLGPHYIR